MCRAAPRRVGCVGRWPVAEIRILNFVSFNARSTFTRTASVTYARAVAFYKLFIYLKLKMQLKTFCFIYFSICFALNSNDKLKNFNICRKFCFLACLFASFLAKNFVCQFFLQYLLCRKVFVIYPKNFFFAEIFFGL